MVQFAGRVPWTALPPAPCPVAPALLSRARCPSCSVCREQRALIWRPPRRRAPLFGRRPLGVSACAAAGAGPACRSKADARQPVGPGLKVARPALCAAAVLAWALVSAGRGGPPLASLSVAAGHASQEGLQTSVRSAWAGLAAGCLHTLSGPDHLAALTPLTIGRSHVRGALLGALWGFGHSIGQLLLGLLMVILKDRFTALVPALSKYGSVTVGLTLMVIGVTGLYETLTEEAEPHVELAGAGASVGSPAAQAAAGGVRSQPPLEADACTVGSNARTLFTGIVFGLQPDALFVIVPALALPTKLAAFAYIVTFVIGTVAAMGGYAALIGATSKAIERKSTWMTTRLSGAASLVALSAGLVVLASSLGLGLPFPQLLSAH